MVILFIDHKIRFHIHNIGYNFVNIKFKIKSNFVAFLENLNFVKINLQSIYLTIFSDFKECFGYPNLPLISIGTCEGQ